VEPRRKSMSNEHFRKTADLWRDNDLEQRFQSLGAPSNASGIPGCNKGESKTKRNEMIRGCSDVSLVSELHTRESIEFLQGALTDMISALIDQSGAGNRALVSYYAGIYQKLNYYVRTCSAPFSFSGRLRTSAFVNRVITRLYTRPCLI
jgi:hypothetical protein